MVRVEIHNFQSIESEAIEIDGFTALVGRSNIGKSAIVRAIKAAITGAPAEGFVRHGPLCLRVVKGAKNCKCFCSVRILTQDFDLLWEKGDGRSIYKFNNVDYSAVGQGTPEFLASLGFDPIVLGDKKKEHLQIADQFTPIFLLNQSGPVVADVLSDVAKLDSINVASRAVEKDRREAVATRKVRDKDIVDLRSSLQAYAGLDNALLGVAQVEVLEKALQVKSLEASRLGQYVDHLYALVKSVKNLEGSESVVLPDLNNIVNAASVLGALTSYVSRIESRVQEVSRLKGVDTLQIPESMSLGDQQKTLSDLTRWATSLQELKQEFERVRSVESVVVPDFNLDTPWKTFSALRVLASQFEVADSVVQKLTDSLADVEEKEAAVLEEFAQLGVCPTCQQSVSHHKAAHA